jgi:hypothetical protein
LTRVVDAPSATPFEPSSRAHSSPIASTCNLEWLRLGRVVSFRIRFLVSSWSQRSRTGLDHMGRSPRSLARTGSPEGIGHDAGPRCSKREYR